LKNARTYTWSCAKWSDKSGLRKPSHTKSTTRSATNRSGIMWSRLVSIMTHISSYVRMYQ
jgi:hypothetical protein